MNETAAIDEDKVDDDINTWSLQAINHISDRLFCYVALNSGSFDASPKNRAKCVFDSLFQARFVS